MAEASRPRLSHARLSSRGELEAGDVVLRDGLWIAVLAVGVDATRHAVRVERRAGRAACLPRSRRRHFTALTGLSLGSRALGRRDSGEDREQNRDDRRDDQSAHGLLLSLETYAPPCSKAFLLRGKAKLRTGSRMRCQ